VARPRMKLGEWGRISITGEVRDEAGRWSAIPAGTRKADRWRARAKVRDLDGVLRDVERYAPTKAAAERALTEALRERVAPAPSDAGIKPDTLMRDAAAVWWSEVESGGRHSLSTLRVYGYALRSHIVGTDDDPAHLAHLTVREVKVSTVERRLREVATTSGEGAAKQARNVLRGVLGLAVKHDAIPSNPVREIGPITVPRGKGKPKRVQQARAFTADECEAVLTFAVQDKRATARDLPDLVAFLAGTGARIGEACALRWSALDLDKGTADLGPTVVRVKGEGLHIQQDGKSLSATRTVHLPPRLVARLLDRRVNHPGNQHGVVFASPRGALRDPSNTSHDVRDLLSDAAREVYGEPERFSWATSHTFRKGVATALHEAGVPDVQVSNHLGHSRPSMTQDHYLSRRETPARAAEVL
jgi:integrase